MKKLTDAQVAKALGWVDLGMCGYSTFDVHKGWKREDGKKVDLPAFTTSLDAIVGEIERRELHWNVYGSTKAAFKPWYIATLEELGPHGEKNAPLALCHALLNYLRREK